jgi:hypothetical protein
VWYVVYFMVGLLLTNILLQGKTSATTSIPALSTVLVGLVRLQSSLMVETRHSR